MAQHDRPVFGIHHVLTVVLVVGIAGGLFRHAALALHFTTEEMFQTYVLLVFLIGGGILGHRIFRRLECTERPTLQRGPSLRQSSDEDREPYYLPKWLQKRSVEFVMDDYHDNFVLGGAFLAGALAYFLVIPLANALIFGP